MNCAFMCYTWRALGVVIVHPHNEEIFSIF